MEMDNRAMMNEVGGAFMVSWMVLAGAGLGSLEGAVLLLSLIHI